MLKENITQLIKEVNSFIDLYYDTDDNYLIRTSLEKPYYKEKIRLRSYYSPAQPDDRVFLEIKKKIGGIVTKRRVSMTLAQAEDFLKYGNLPPESSKYIQNQVMAELVQFLKTYRIHPDDKGILALLKVGKKKK
jgi:hypothetical protein